MRDVYLDRTEITNLDWREYLYYLKKHTGADSKEYLSAIPDTAIWRLSYNVPFFKPGPYDDYPLVAVSYEQAESYCTWRSRVVSQKEKRQVTYALPSLKIYQLMAKGENKVAEGLYSVKLGFRTFLGLCENAAEMTDIEGKAIAGSDRVQCLEIHEYFIPEKNLGFRCMARVN